MGRKLQVLTNSELETWRACPRRHGLAYVELLRPQVDALPRRAGGILHDGLEAGWRAAWSDDPEEGGGPGWESLDTRLDRAISGAVAGVARATKAAILELEELGETDPTVDVDEPIEDLEKACEANTWAVQHYFRAVKPDLEFLPVIIEGEFTARVPNRAGQASMIQRKGKIDLVLWDRKLNRLIVQDHKGTANAVSAMEGKLPLDTQLTGYVVALRRLQATGQLIDQARTTKLVQRIMLEERDKLMAAKTGAIAFNVLRRKAPDTPKINLLKKGQVRTENQAKLLELQAEDGQARGEVSVAAVDTLADIYRDALEEQAIDRELPITDKQKAVYARLMAKGDTFFAQLEYFRNDGEILLWRDELVEDARRIREATRDPRKRTRNPGACSMPWSPPCPYAALCINADDPTARNGFVVVDRPHVELNPTEEHGTE